MLDELMEKARQAKSNKKKERLEDLMPVVDVLRKNGLEWTEVKEWLEKNAGKSYYISTLMNCYGGTGGYKGKDWRAKQ